MGHAAAAAVLLAATATAVSTPPALFRGATVPNAKHGAAKDMRAECVRPQARFGLGRGPGRGGFELGCGLFKDSGRNGFDVAEPGKSVGDVLVHDPDCVPKFAADLELRRVESDE